MRAPLVAAVLFLTGAPAAGCEVALVLAVDVSGSVDPSEYRLQIDGMADAFADPDVIDALVEARATLTVVQWSATRLQAVTQDWATMATPEDVTRFSAEARAAPRVFDGSDTAVSNALAFAADLFTGPAADCRRKVIDISGDGAQNAGVLLPPVRSDVLSRGIEINAVAIEELGLPITEFYRRHVISPGGFVMTARGHLDYPRAIRDKILREVVRPGA